MGKELNEIKDEAIKLNSIIQDWKDNYKYIYFYLFYSKCEEEKADFMKRVELLKLENKMKNDEIMRLTEEINNLYNDKNILLSEMNDKNNLAETLTKEIKKNEDIVNNFNSINKENFDKDQIIKELKNKIYQMEKNRPNKIYFDLKENE